MADLVFPPLTPFDVMPMHGGRASVDVREKFACMGAQWDAPVAFDWRCSDCLRAAIGFADAGHANDEMLWIPKNGDPPQRVTLAWNIERARYWGIS